jgi:signal peptide peptidase SppA
MEIQKESIMRNAARSFFKSLMKILGFSFGIAIVLVVISIFSNKDLLPPPAQFSIAPDADGQRKLLPMNTPAIAILKVDDVIGMNDLTAEKFKELLSQTREGMLDLNRTKALLIHINSPGGTVIDSDNIYLAIKKYKEEFKVPVVAFVDGLCASGGMYIASACDQIFATRSSIIGSVGVRIGPMFNLVGTLEKYGAYGVTLTKGKSKDSFNMFRPWTPDEGANFEQMINLQYDRFLNIVTQARPNLSRDKLINEYGAQIFLAETAKEYGYVDSDDATYESTIKHLAQLAGVQDGENYQVFELSVPHTVLDTFSRAKVENMVRSFFGLPPVQLNGKILFM